jgi:ribokinase
VSRAAQVVVVGSINEDQVLRVEALPRRGETVLAVDVTTSGGGKGANQAVAASRAGAHARLVGALGTDARAMRLMAQLRLHGVDTTLDRVPGSSGGAVVLVDREGDNSIVVHAGANAQLSAGFVKQSLEDLAREDVVLAQCEIPIQAVRTAVESAAAVGATVVLNWSPVRPLPDDVAARGTVLVVNRGEAKDLLTGSAKADAEGAELAAALADRYGTDVVVTLGADGAACCTEGRLVHVPAEDMPAVVDTTGAGDTFAGALSAALSHGAPLVEATRRACTAASAAVASLGAQPAPPTPLSALAATRP